ncbi:MAG TPA: NAD-dependent malic enzyme [Phycisphaerae bacterium]|nr:NAD-dependent malic enzyme [Phycisphaerae bacterium]HPU27855.1 NAD-dependent malic enzyme [Phycisphaerae bacterium]HQA00147.1 NAD-dependent malic enzyme [Phycisphaerae bacterium]HQE29470.1 NAD-dependent malic enzyme [Phycisphaerae bacterium]
MQDYFRQTQDPNVIETTLRGMPLLRFPLLNKGTAFTAEEREQLNLLGLLPTCESNLDAQLERVYGNFLAASNDLDRYIYLRSLQDRNETLFYALIRAHLSEMLPIIYTPGVGMGCLEFSRIYRSARGIYVPYLQRHRIDKLLENRPCRDVDVIVVTDGERILGLGDQGAGGMGIPIGKLSLYTACGGINPARTLPICLDVGTDNPKAMANPLYVGWRHSRVRGEEYYDFIEAFVRAVQRTMPDAILQWEDFATVQARTILDRYRDQLCTFNDDIQGTAAVTLAAILCALQRTGGRLAEQRIVLVGAGSAGLGIAEEVVKALAEEGVPAAQAKRACWICDSCGLIYAGRDRVDAAKAAWARPADEVASWQRSQGDCIELAEVVRQVAPTVLVGISGRSGMFDERVVREMAARVERPVILPLSNPTSLSEARPVDLIEWTQGRALIATGSPFEPVDYSGRRIHIAQCNNCYIFPGVGLGAIVARARRITDRMMLAASRALCTCELRTDDTDQPLLPPLERICEVSRCIALAVARQAVDDRVAPPASGDELAAQLQRVWWDPYYRTIRPAPDAAG